MYILIALAAHPWAQIIIHPQFIRHAHLDIYPVEIGLESSNLYHRCYTIVVVYGDFKMSNTSLNWQTRITHIYMHQSALLSVLTIQRGRKCKPNIKMLRPFETGSVNIIRTQLMTFVCWKSNYIYYKVWDQLLIGSQNSMVQPLKFEIE